MFLNIGPSDEIMIVFLTSFCIFSYCNDPELRVKCLDDIKKLKFFQGVDWDHIRERPAVCPILVSAPKKTES